jgi:hypothetical protein
VRDFGNELEKEVSLFASRFVVSGKLPAAEKHLHVIEDYQTAILAQIVEKLGELGFYAVGNFGLR